MKSIIKSVISFVLLLCIVLLYSSCDKVIDIFQKNELDAVIDGVFYDYDGEYYSIDYIGKSSDAENMKYLFIRDYINGLKVKYSGNDNYVMPSSIKIFGTEVERIYYPWTINGFYSINWRCGREDIQNLKYIVSSSNADLMIGPDNDLNFDYLYEQGWYVITNWLYEKELSEGNLIDNVREYYIPANISFMFNHEANPNEGYFFVDLVEEGGIITKPPYDPQREGYTFSGWYKDEGCTEAWDFEKDEVEIHFDEEGNRIYEEIKLYAGWEERSDYGFYPENIAFMLNYAGAPNNGYFYTTTKKISGRLRKPPTEPVRIGFIFDGWYKDPDCTEEWDFKSDKVKIHYEKGDLVYEEIRLYAKWKV